jgi:peptide/nickel transport system substrate-binding protein
LIWRGGKSLAFALAIALLANTFSITTSSAAKPKTTKSKTVKKTPAKPVVGGTLNLLLDSPRFTHLDPARVYLPRDRAFVTSFLYRTLVTYRQATGATGTELVPDLATNTGIVSKDGKTWSFKLRPGLKFEDGKAITCENIKYSISRIFAQDLITNGPTHLISLLDIPIDAKGKSIYTGPYSNSPEGLTAFDKAVLCSKDKKTITFKLSRPEPDFNHLATFGYTTPIQPEKDMRDLYDLRPESTGPYKIAEYTDLQLRLIRNKNWNSKIDTNRTAYPKEIVVRFNLARETIDQTILDDSIPNAISLVEPLRSNQPKFFATKKLKSRTLVVPDNYVRYFAFNTRAIPCLEARKAISLAWPTKALLDLQGGEKFAGSYATGSISPLVHADYAPTKRIGPGSADFLPEGNSNKALEILNQARAKCPNVVAKLNTSGLRIDVRKSNDFAITSPIINEALAKIGIPVIWNEITTDYIKTVRQPNSQSDLSSAGWFADWPRASAVIPEIFLAKGEFNLTQNETDENYKAFAAKVDKARKTMDSKARSKLWRELDAEAAGYFWHLPTTFGKVQFVWGSSVQNVIAWDTFAAPVFGRIWLKK